jgi:hypothetical protein
VIGNLTTSELIISFGLLLDIVGILLLSVSGIIQKKPIRTWWYLWRHVDRENPEETEKAGPVDIISQTGGGLGSGVPPRDSDEYDWQIRLVAKQTLGAGGLILGLVLQLIGTLM